MKVTKEEKSLWNFLNVFKSIFSKTNNRTIVYGMNNFLYLYTLNYAGKFISKQNQDKLMPDYTFGGYFYELKQLPNNQFVLDIVDDPISQSEIEKIILTIDTTISSKKYCCEVNKNDEFKIAKITETTGLWMLDSDLKYINTFPHAEILSSVNDSLVIHGAGINDDELSAVETYLIFSQLESIHAVQQKFDIKELSENETLESGENTYLEEKKLDDLISEAEEEFENGYDPMHA